MSPTLLLGQPHAPPPTLVLPLPQPTTDPTRPSQTPPMPTPPPQPPQPTTQTQPPRPTRKPGRPATYTFDKPDSQLSEKERKLKTAIEKRRLRQNRSYHRRKKTRRAAAAAAAASAPASASASVTTDPTTAPLTTTPTPSLTPVPPGFPPPPVAFTTWATSGSAVTPPVHAMHAPRLVPGFAQNPLDLLATAGGSLGPVGGGGGVVCSDASMAVSSVSGVVGSKVAEGVGMFREGGMAAEVNGGIPEVDATLDLDAGSSQLDITFPFVGKLKDDDEDVDSTDALVSGAMVAAREYASTSLNLRDVMDREVKLRERTGIKELVFDNLRTTYLSMPREVQNALRHFVVFPRTFSLRAAGSVAGMAGEEQVMNVQVMVDVMVKANFMTAEDGRYEMHDAARMFLMEDGAVLQDNMSDGTLEVAQKRFVSFYRTQLSRLQDDNIHKIGWMREEAMALYDTERENMVFSEYLLSDRPNELREFLSAGVTVMRYCVSASNREQTLRKALMDDETSTESILMPFGEDTTVLDASASSDDNQKISECDKSHRARLQLALSEAYFDQLRSEDAEKPLLQALKLMGDVMPTCAQASSGVVDSVLVLLLLSNLRLSANKIKDARILCVKALKILAEANLGRSTFGINAMSNLVTIYLEEGHLDKAKSVASRLLDTLNNMRYMGMPIYADALGVCAMVSMAERKYVDAERQYNTAIETIGRWEAKQWIGTPVQHCLDLDLWLQEGLAEAIRRQGRVEEAERLEQQAAEGRESRGLPRSCGVPDFLQFGQQDRKQESSIVLECRPKLRHLY